LGGGPFQNKKPAFQRTPHPTKKTNMGPVKVKLWGGTTGKDTRIFRTPSRRLKKKAKKFKLNPPPP